ncbi:competence protein CoiA family protein [Alkalihalophilus lindianensis]|uniref:Competence protein CoiA family protein n=1 Tax=Alkalihalophilus lindianensis TaxID=1630542 RepID=A0ABU3XB14_9BACI|nr:competence protein CoiA family protein [Alkalihalophilus lindianensis]MDV2685070.1 competence protein CoiA family protein [Alkalihalophilus lindianensis]
MLTAKLKDGSLISMADSWSFEQLIEMRKDVLFYCPCCTSELQLKIGLKKQWHFAHKKNALCTIQGEPESLYHLKGKKQLYEWLKNQGVKVALEVYLPLIRQRPDILFKVGSQLYALEYQCSPIDHSQLEKRTRGYEQLGIIPIWIFGGNRLKRLGANVFSIKSFEWYANTIQKSSSPTIHYYCSEQSKWMSLYHTTPYSSTKYLASLIETSSSLFPLSNLLRQPTYSLPSYEHWLFVKKNWRYVQPTPYPSKTQRFFQQLLYYHHLSPSQFPIEAGWPSSSHCLIETSPHIWQSYLLFACLLQKPLHQPITLTSIQACFLRKELYRWLKLRPSYHPSLIEDAILGYVTFLTEIGFLKEISNKPKTYVRQRDLEVPKSTEEAIKLDRQLANLCSEQIFAK